MVTRIEDLMQNRDWRCGAVTPTGDSDPNYTVMGQWDDLNRWNGWLSPSMDPWGIEKVLTRVNADPDYYQEYGMDYQWAQDRNGLWCLIVVDRQYLTEDDYPVEVIAPDEDGLYGLGGWAWTWAEVEGGVPAAFQWGKP